LPFLLRLASAPADHVPETADWRNTKGQQVMDYDDEYAPTPEEIAAEEKEEPLMMQNSTRWDNFLNYAWTLQKPWPQGEADIDEYREGRAVEAFNAYALCSNDLLELKPALLSWVPHVGQFIAPRQYKELGDPARRAADACESYGAKMKKTIKHLTCRRSVPGAQKEQVSYKGDSDKKWRKAFSKGYIEQAFSRASVSESLKHGEENAPYLLRSDAKQTSVGKANVVHKVLLDSPAPMRSIHSLAQELELA
jgi:hypothetical protein